MGDSVSPFTGSLDGQTHAISNLSISLPSTTFVGIFGFIDGATVKNLRMVDAHILGDQQVGILAGAPRQSAILAESAKQLGAYSNREAKPEAHSLDGRLAPALC